MELQESISKEKNRAFERQTLDVLIEETDGSTAYGRTQYDAPEVDNECILDMNDHAVKPGDFCKAAIEDSASKTMNKNQQQAPTLS